MDETPQARVSAVRPEPPSAFRKDLLRGIRWGTILLLVMLLSITAYRMLSSGQAVASQPKTAEELAPAVDIAPAAAIQVGDAVLKTGPDAPPAPALVPQQPRNVRKTAAKAAPTLPEPLQHLQSPRFAPLPVVAGSKPVAATFVAEPLPEPAPTTAANVSIPISAAVPAPAPSAAPAAADNLKQSNRAVRAVRSVGRLFRLGRKDEASKDEPTKK